MEVDEMKQLILPFLVINLLLAGCGQVEEDIGDTLLYAHSETLAHEMEGVLLDMTYSLSEVQHLSEIQKQHHLEEGSIILEGNVTIQNDTDHPVYYSPSFYAITEDGKRFDNMADQLVQTDVTAPYTIKAGQEIEFVIAFNLPKQIYNTVDSLDLTVPVAFKEPDSVSSGDALGDTTTWNLPLRK